MAQIKTKFQRPSTQLVESVADLGAATVYEAAGCIGSVDPAIKPLGRGVQIVGSALTIQCFPRDNLMLHKALQVAQPDNIIVATEEVLEAANQRVQKEIDKAAALRTGKTSMKLNKLHAVIESLGLVEK